MDYFSSVYEIQFFLWFGSMIKPLQLSFQLDSVISFSLFTTNLSHLFWSISPGAKGSWGSCKPLCKQRCLPTCNLVCCIAPPYNVPRKTVKRLEKQLGRKSTIKKHAKKKKSTIKKYTKKEKSATKKDRKTAGVCNSSCQKACLPSCDFRCCFAPKKH